MYFIFNYIRAAVVATLVILGILFLTSFILALRVVVAKLVIIDVFNLMYLSIKSSKALMSFLTTLFFTTSLSLLKSTRKGFNLSTSNLSSLIFKLLKLLVTFFNLLSLIYIHQNLN